MGKRGKVRLYPSIVSVSVFSVAEGWDRQVRQTDNAAAAMLVESKKRWTLCLCTGRLYAIINVSTLHYVTDRQLSTLMDSY